MLRFGSFELDVAGEELLRDGRPVLLAPKPLRLLLFLARNRHRMVSRAETLRVVWPGVRVSGAAFTSVLRDLRRALDDHSHPHRYVSTIRGLGLRFVAPVEPESIPSGVAGRRLDGRPFVGRERAIGLLRDALESASRRRGGVVLLAGPPGIGKTWLAEAFAEEARAGGVPVYRGYGVEAGFTPPFRPWRQVLAPLLESSRGHAALRALGGPESEVARLLHDLAFVHEGGVARSAGENESEGAELQLFDTVTSLLRRASRDAPLVVMLNDLHRADRSSLHLLSFLAEEIPGTSLLVVGSYRTTALASDHPLVDTLDELMRYPHVRRIYLEGFTGPETRDLVRCVAGVTLDDDWVASLLARTDGNPFFVNELARALAEHAAVGGLPSRAEWERELPSGVRELVLGRRARLAPEVQAVLEVAAAMGCDFSLAVVARVAELDVERVFDAVEEARRAGLVAAGTSDPRRFAHALVQEVLYDALGASHRIDLHRRIGDVLAECGPESLVHAAFHLCRAVDRVGRRAVDVAERVARQQGRRLAFEDAARAAEMALDALARTDPDDVTRRCDLLLLLAQQRLGAREVERAWAAARDAAGLARELGSAERLAEAGLVLSDHVVVDGSEPLALLEDALARLPAEPTPLRVRVLCVISEHLRYERQPERRLAVTDEALAAARACGDPGAVVAALLARHHALCAPGSVEERVDLASEALREAERLGNDTQRCLVYSWRATDRLEAGAVGAAEQDVEAVERIARTGHLLRFFGFAPRWRAVRATLAGRFAEARQAIAEAEVLMRRAQDPNARPFTALQLGVVMIEEGRAVELDALMETLGKGWLGDYRMRVGAVGAALALVDLECGREASARRWLETAGANAFASLDRDPEPLGTASWLAELCVRLCDRGHAEQLYLRVSPWRHLMASLYAIACRGSVARWAGLLAQAAGRVEEASSCLEEALAVNRAIGADLEVAWTQHDLGRLLFARNGPGDAVRAASLARRSRETAHRLGAHRLLQAATPEPGAAPAAP